MKALSEGTPDNREVVGLIPAGGEATRIAPLPCSKELYPVGFQTRVNDRRQTPKVVCQYLLEKMRLAGIQRAYMILRKGKWDIPNYFGDGSMLNMHIAYLVLRRPYGVPYTLDQAYPFIRDATIAMGFPDILLEPQDTFSQLLSRLSNTKADIVLGVYPTLEPHNVDMIDRNSDGRVHEIVVKPKVTQLTHAWVTAVWKPKFTRFMHGYVWAKRKEFEHYEDHHISKELHIGHVMQAAIENHYEVDSVLFSNHFMDIGTPNMLMQASNIALVNTERHSQHMRNETNFV